jgi:circadian clock protein KaiB
MAEEDNSSTAREFEAQHERLLEKGEGEEGRYLLVLYVAGASARSRRAILNLERICGQYLPSRCEIRVVDIFQQPELAKEAQLLASPTLIKKLPLPIRQIIGDLSDTERVLAGIDLKILPKTREPPK